MRPRYHELPMRLNLKHGWLRSHSSLSVLISVLFEMRSQLPARPSIFGSSTCPSMTNFVRPHLKDPVSLSGGNGIPRWHPSLAVLDSVFCVVSGGSVTSMR